MGGESAYRVIVGGLTLLALAISVHHRRRAAASGETVSRRDEGRAILVLLRLLGLAMWLGVLAYLVNPRWMAWSQLPLPGWLRWTGLGFGLPAVALVYWTFRHLGGNVTDTVATRAEHRLVTSGPYRWVRHPLYASGLLFVPFWSLLTASWFIPLAAILAAVPLFLRTRIEEEKLLARFGAEYEGHMRRTGRFVPRLRS